MAPMRARPTRAPATSRVGDAPVQIIISVFFQKTRVLVDPASRARQNRLLDKDPRRGT